MPFLELSPEALITTPLCGYLPDADPWWRTRSFSISSYQFLLFTGNGVRIQRSHQQLETRGGDFILLRPNEVHGGWGEADSGSGFYWIRFWVSPPPREVTQPVMVTHPALGNEPLAIPLWGRFPEPEGVLALAAEVVAEREQRRPHFHLRTHALLAEIFVAAVRHGLPYESDVVALRTDAPGKADIVLRMLAYLQERCTTPVSGAELECALGYSYAYLCRLFRRATGLTVRAYLHQLRISKARDLLLDYGLHYNVRQVAEAVGYEDPAYFSRVFRDVTGASPRRFVARVYAP